jgi:hypothetical protein
MTSFFKKSRTNRRHFVAANKVALQRVAVPASENERLTVVSQHLLRQLGNIVPAVGNINGKILTVDISTVGVNDADFFGRDGGGLHTHYSDRLLIKVKKNVRRLVCAPHRVKLRDFAILEVADGSVVDDRPISLHALRDAIALEVWEVLGPTNGDIKRRHGIELVTTVRGAQAITEADGIVASLESSDHADLFPPPIADILEDNIVGRIIHNVIDVGLF